MKRMLLAVVALGVLCAHGGDARRLVLAKRGQASDYTIVLPDAPSPSQTMAAHELQTHVLKMTGVLLPIATNATPKYGIFLGDGEENLGSDGFRFESCPPHFRIRGGKVHGTLFGVNDFLERHCGCEWFSSSTSVIPVRDDVSVPVDMNETHRPAFLFRDANWWEQQHDFAFAARMKFNGFYTPYPDAFGGQDIGQDCGAGGAVFERIVPSKKYFKDHPEWFSERNGKRIGWRSQLCLTNPEVLDLLTSNVFARIRKSYPRFKRYAIYPNDWRNWCECRQCKAIDDREEAHMGSILMMLNTVAERVTSVYPDVYLHTLAYSYSLKPPKHLKPHKNVMIVFCTDRCDFSKPIRESRWEGSQKFVRDFAAWRNICDKLYIWDYSAQFAYIPMAFECVHCFPANFAYFRDGGAIGVFEEGHHKGMKGPDFALKTWVMAHLLWDPDQPIEALLTRFFKGYYGAASEVARSYYDELVELERKRDERKTPLKMWGLLEDETLPVEFFDKWSARWKAALDLVKDDPVLTENVEWALHYVDLVRIARETAFEDVTLTKAPDGFRARLESLSLDAQRILKDLARVPRAGNFSTMTKFFHGRINALAKIQASNVKGVDVLSIGSERMGMERDLHGYSRVEDRKAIGGKAIRIDAAAEGWRHSIYLDVRDVSMEVGLKVRVRIHARVEKTGSPGLAFHAGVVNKGFTYRAIKSYDVRAEAVPDDGEYHWYEIPAVWMPKSDERLWIGNGRHDERSDIGNPAIRAFYVDCVELSIVDGR